ncbi:Galactose oxidase/kelch repeat superfamily protein [Raphanus sativus]|nr:Galactose oxidase/kelch repeat superfamily protein [Raphanus sativus]
MHILREATDWVCVVENVLYACYRTSGLIWLDTNVNVWRRVVSRYAVEVCRLAEHAVGEYEGKLAVFELIKHGRIDNTKSVKMFLFSFHRVGEKMLGTIEWSGIVATDLSFGRFLHCFGTII